MREITNKEQLRVWLKDKPDSWAHVVSIRIAMRLVPLFANYGVSKGGNNYLIVIFRAVLVAFAAVAWPSTVLRSAASSSSTAFYPAEAMLSNDEPFSRAGGADRRAVSVAQWSFRGPLQVIFSASQDVTDVTDVAASAASSAEKAIEILSAYNANISPFDFWKAIEADVNWFQERMERQLQDTAPERALLFHQLWSKNIAPSGEILLWNSRKNILSNAQLHWDVWIKWYERRINGNESSFGLLALNDKNLTIEIAQKADMFWSREAAVINEEIQNILDRVELGSRYDELKLPEIPDQKNAPIVTCERAGRVARFPSSSLLPTNGARDSRRRSGYIALIEALDDFEEAFPTHNHSGLKKAMERLRLALGDSFECLEVIRAGVVAERIQQYALRADEIFMPEMAADVVALNVNLGINIAHFDEWLEYKIQIKGEFDESIQAIEAGIDIMTPLLDSEIIEEDIKADLIDISSSFTIPLGENKSTKIERLSFMRSLSNVVATVAKIAIKACKNYGCNFAEGFGTEGAKEFGKQASIMLVYSFSAYLLTLVSVSPQFAWALPVVAFLKLNSQQK